MIRIPPARLVHLIGLEPAADAPAETRRPGAVGDAAGGAAVGPMAQKTQNDTENGQFQMDLCHRVCCVARCPR